MVARISNDTATSYLSTLVTCTLFLPLCLALSLLQSLQALPPAQGLYTFTENDSIEVSKTPSSTKRDCLTIVTAFDFISRFLDK